MKLYIKTNKNQIKKKDETKTEKQSDKVLIGCVNHQHFFLRIKILLKIFFAHLM